MKEKMLEVSKMQKSIEKQGRTLEEATESALNALGVEREKVEVEVLEDGKTGFLGFGSRNAKVRATLKKEFRESREASYNRQENAAEKKDVPVVSSETDPGPSTDPERAKELLTGLLQRMNMESAIETRIRDGHVIMNVIGKDSNLLIGKKGQTLDAMQFLINLMYSKSMRKKANIVVDVEEYRVRREERLRSIALEVREKVKRSRKSVAIAPMNSQDRRIIHLTLQNDEFVKTVSKGEGLLRKVVVIPKS
jgi:spoIIIJ-associated protein